jgi:hypothetical protein
MLVEQAFMPALEICPAACFQPAGSTIRGMHQLSLATGIPELPPLLIHHKIKS